MRNLRTFGMIVAVALTLGGRPSLASWAYVAPETYFDEAEAIVVGKMTQVQKYEGTGVIAVTQVLKGDEGPAPMKVRVRFSAVPKPRKDGMTAHQSDTIAFHEGQEGIWLLIPRLRDETGTYRVNMPLLHYDRHGVERVSRMIAARKALPWGEPVDGLAVRALVHRQQPQARRVHIYLAVKNVSGEPMRVSDWRGHKLIQATIVAPDGTVRQLDLYSFLQLMRLAAPKRTDFPELAPGEVRYVSFRSGFGAGPLEKEGVYEVRLSYTNRDNGEALKLANVWTGTITAPPVKMTIEAEKAAPKL